MSSTFSSVLGGLGGGEIGRASVNLVLNTQQYEAGLAKAEATTAESTTAMSSTAVAAFAVAGAAAVLFAKVSIAAAIEQQQASDKLANSIENSAKVSFASVDAFNAQANSLRNMTGVSDEAVTRSQALLVQMGATADQVTKLTPLIVDLSAKTGIDLNTATKAVGKAINGNVGGLTRLGVVIDKAAAKTDAFAATMRGLGAAEGFAAQKANAEPWVKLTAQFHEVEESVGKGLLPALVDLTGVSADIAQAKLPQMSSALHVLQLGFTLSSANITQWGAGIQRGGSDLAGFQTALDAVNAELAKGNITGAEAVTMVHNLAVEHGFAEATVNQLSAAEEQAAAAMTKSTHEVTKNTAALRANRQQILSDAGGILGLSANLAQLADDEAKVNAARRKGTLDTKAGQDAERTYLTDKIQFIQALQTERAAMIKNHDSTQQIVTTLTQLGTAAGITRQEIMKLIAGINSLPSNKKVTIDVVQTGHVGRVNMPTGP